MQITKAVWLLASLALVGCTGNTGTDDKETDTDTETDTVQETDDTTVVETDDTVETDTEPVDACLATTPVLRVGTGESQFIAIPPNSDIYMVAGGQGGWHVPISIQVENATESIHYKIRGVDPADESVVLIDVEGTTAFVPSTGPGGTWECDGYLHNLPGLIDPDTYSLQSGVYAWEHLCGDDVKITVTLYTIGDNLADLTELVSATINAKLQPDPCDCDACGAVVVRQCATTNPASPRYDSTFVRACEQTDTDPPDTDN